MLENTIHSIVGLARAEKALFTVTGISLGPFLHIDPKFLSQRGQSSSRGQRSPGVSCA